MIEPLKRLEGSFAMEVGRCYFQGLVNEFNREWACECHVLVWMGVLGGQHSRTITAMIVVSLVILSRLDFRVIEVEID